MIKYFSPWNISHLLISLATLTLGEKYSTSLKFSIDKLNNCVTYPVFRCQAHLFLLSPTMCFMQEMREIRFLAWEDPLEKEMATHSSILAWRIPWTAHPSLIPLAFSAERHWVCPLHILTGKQEICCELCSPWPLQPTSLTPDPGPSTADLSGVTC